MGKHNHHYSIVSHDTLNDPPHRGYIEDRKILETPETIYTKSLVGRVWKVLKRLKDVYTMVEDMRRV